ncbi:cyclic nucleotide-binding domain-containing protein [Spirosoma sp. KUDC1026]|uniref:cyclic nucleotide-binding domain-containing protein n=1 Tax=Spirosoma sp. KUDC1026 TaxID=2745947 RepID=UPI00159BC661|nr:cyclic nucleotide-binding domain-containing protein [Spirosoma sp. KUDC1026]QKZ15454.1 cyclic nucleotide-binding domain-containing protein [Spirosoma sp. KUDC1026]
MYAGTDQSYDTSAPPRWQRLFGIRPGEARTVGLFFAHNFLLGIGTILIYVSANAILLENHPESSLPIAYIASALAMIGVGQLYAYFEHHLPLNNLAIRVLLAVTVMTAIVAVLVVVGHSVAAAISIMVGYRLIYLLSNLEFWGVSAVVFDTRQSKRLFSVISSGDMPAKALGAVLAALVHAHADILRLLLLAFATFLGALYTLRLTIQSHEVHAPHSSARPVRPPSRLLGQAFGGSKLVFFMCLSMAALAAVATEIEYNFFVNVKHRFHDQAEVIYYVSLVLTLTYGVAMVVKLLLSRQALDRFGVRRSLLLLPSIGLAGIVGLALLNQFTTDETTLVVYFCGLYLFFEVIRRALFDPVFLVLFQPLAPAQRLTGHTLAKGLYEPVGLGLAGFFLYLLHSAPSLSKLMPFIWIILLATALWLLLYTYRYYLIELNDAIGRRFLERDQLAMPKAAQAGLVNQLSSANPEEVLTALNWLAINKPDELTDHLPVLLGHSDASVRRRALVSLATLNQKLPVQAVSYIALTDAESDLRQQASYLLGRRINAGAGELGTLLHHTDLAIRQGGIRGALEANRQNSVARQSLLDLVNSSGIEEQQAGLKLIATLHLTDLSALVKQRLTRPEPALVHQAMLTASQLATPELTSYLVDQLTNESLGRPALTALKSGQPGTISVLKQALRTTPSRLLVERVATICGTIRTPESRQILNSLVQQPDLGVRGAALRALRRFSNEPDDDAIFRALLTDELLLAQRLLHGSLDAPELARTLDYELGVLTQRLFDILAQLYDTDTINGARLGVGHPARERRANALEILDNLIPRRVYQTMQVLIDELPRAERVRTLDAELGAYNAQESIQAYVAQAGETVFSSWTVHAVYRLSPNQETTSSSQALLSTSPSSMSHSVHQVSSIPEYDRVLLLAKTSLFAQTPENVLASITPIMKEEQHRAGEVIFRKGDLGTGMYVIYSGEVSILDGETELARFGRGDFFGELALLDTEARSATAQTVLDVKLLRLDQDDFFDLMEERSEVLRSIVRSLSGRIRRQNDLLAGRSAAGVH